MYVKGRKQGNFMKTFLNRTGVVAVFLGCILLLALTFLYFRDTTPPQAALDIQGNLLGRRALNLSITDNHAGIKALKVTVVQGTQNLVLLEKTFPEHTLSAQETLNLETHPLKDGPIQIRIETTDHAMFHFGDGNSATQSFDFIFDATAPRITVLSLAHNLTQGGSGMVVFQVSEEVEKAGIYLGDLFFPAYRQDSGNYACLIPFPHGLPLADFTPRISAVDKAGNEGKGGFSYHLNPGKFRHDKINVSDAFLNSKMPQFEREFPEATNPLELFRKVNGELRVRNRQELLNIGKNTAPRFLFDGDFVPMGRAANKASFGDVRTYMYNGQEVDEQTHLGIDLASVEQAPIHTANTGRVVYAGFFGIFGNCVIVDHGLGLQTLYSHLTEIKTQVGADLRKGDLVGTSGATGMAGGDHLHFGVLVGGVEVNPLEWLDPSWITNNVTSKLK